MYFHTLLYATELKKIELNKENCLSSSFPFLIESSFKAKFTVKYFQYTLIFLFVILFVYTCHRLRLAKKNINKNLNDFP